MELEDGVTGGIAIALYRDWTEGKQVFVRKFAHRDEWSILEELVREERHDVELTAVAEAWKQAGLVVEDGELHGKMTVVEQFGFRRWPVQIFFLRVAEGFGVLPRANFMYWQDVWALQMDQENVSLPLQALVSAGGWRTSVLNSNAAGEPLVTSLAGRNEFGHSRTKVSQCGCCGNLEAKDLMFVAGAGWACANREPCFC